MAGLVLAGIALLLSYSSCTEGRHFEVTEEGDFQHVARAFTVDDFPAKYVILSQVRFPKFWSSACG